MQNKVKKILIAAGGTGGHMFPAQALAKELKKKKDTEYQILFVGGGLSTNRYFRRDLFSFKQVASATFFRGKLTRYFFAIAHIFKGIFQSFAILKAFKPDVVVGFGSFHSFPVLVAAVLKRIPLVLFESNALPGRVNRLFSRFATLSTVQFSKASERLKGSCTEVSVPFWERDHSDILEKSKAREYFCLKPEFFTFLVFGGSQGSAAVNRAFTQALKHLNKDKKNVQVIHMAGTDALAEEMRNFYLAEGIDACVKSFEDKMHHAWRAADLAVCRSGAVTLSEVLTFEVPGIFIPFPTASEDHQRVNALFIENEVGGGLHFVEKNLDPMMLAEAIKDLIDPEKKKIHTMKQAIRNFKLQNQKKDLCSVVCDLVARLER